MGIIPFGGPNHELQLGCQWHWVYVFTIGWPSAEFGNRFATWPGPEWSALNQLPQLFFLRAPTPGSCCKALILWQAVCCGEWVWRPQTPGLSWLVQELTGISKKWWFQWENDDKSSKIGIFRKNPVVKQLFQYILSGKRHGSMKIETRDSLKLQPSRKLLAENLLAPRIHWLPVRRFDDSKNCGETMVNPLTSRWNPRCIRCYKKK